MYHFTSGDKPEFSGLSLIQNQIKKYFVMKSIKLFIFIILVLGVFNVNCKEIPHLHFYTDSNISDIQTINTGLGYVILIKTPDSILYSSATGDTFMATIQSGEHIFLLEWNGTDLNYLLDFGAKEIFTRSISINNGNKLLFRGNFKDALKFPAKKYLSKSSDKSLFLFSYKLNSGIEWIKLFHPSGFGFSRMIAGENSIFYSLVLKGKSLIYQKDTMEFTRPLNAVVFQYNMDGKEVWKENFSTTTPSVSFFSLLEVSSFKDSILYVTGTNSGGIFYKNDQKIYGISGESVVFVLALAPGDTGILKKYLWKGKGFIDKLFINENNLNIYGAFQDKICFGKTCLYDSSRTGIGYFLVELKKDNSLNWYHQFSFKTISFTSIIQTKNEDMLLGGIISDTFTFAGKTIDPYFRESVILIVNENGKEKTVYYLKGKKEITNYVGVYDLDIDEEGNLIVGGFFNIELNFMDLKLERKGMFDAFVLKIPEDSINLGMEEPKKYDGHSESPDFYLFPNPAKKHLNIALNTSPHTTSLHKLEIYNLRGRLVKSSLIEIKKSSTVINVDHLPAGLYLIRLYNGQVQYNGKFIKTRRW